MPGLMNGSKKARNISSVTNKISIYGDIGGLIPSSNRKVINDTSRRNKGTNNIFMPVPGLGPAGDVTIAGVVVPPPANSGTTGRAYMMGQNPTGRYMMSRNPACSGGVGRRPPYYKLNPGSQIGSSSGYLFLTRAELDTAVALWVSDEASATDTYGEINTWNVSNITDMSSLFENIATFNSDISNWNVSSVDDMSRMFYDSGFNNGDLTNSSSKPLTNWNVSSVTNMSGMFNGTAFNQDINNWNTGLVQTMATMFKNNNNFNKDISNWDTSAVTDMNQMFRNAQDFDNGGVALDWNNTSLVQNMSNMFEDATAFNQDISNWDTTLVQDMSLMFAGATSFNNGNNPDGLSSWANNLSAILNMENMFNGAVGFGITAAPPTVQGIRSWQIPPGTPVNNMFANMNGLNYSYLNVLTNGNFSWIPTAAQGLAAAAPTPPIGAAPLYDNGSSYFDVQ